MNGSFSGLNTDINGGDMRNVIDVENRKMELGFHSSYESLTEV